LSSIDDIGFERIIILFNGFASSKIFWNYAFEDKPELRKLDFLNKLKKIDFLSLNY